MSISAKYVHTNLVAKDWKKLSLFYQEVFGCISLPPERDLSGPAIESATGIPSAHIRGEHIRLPGWGDQGPSLEIFSYTPEMEHPNPAVNRPGFGHLAFQVDSVEQAINAVLARHGQQIGEMVKVQVGSGFVTFCYLTDPEGNILEVQSWS